MSWHIRDIRPNYPYRPVRVKPRKWFFVSEWMRLHRIMLGLAIKRIARAEAAAMGPSRALLRSKRLRAVRLFEQRYEKMPFTDYYSQWHVHEP